MSTTLEHVTPREALERLPGRTRARRRARRLTPKPPLPAQRLIGPVLLVALWFAVTELGWIDPDKLSSPVTVAQTMGDLIADGRLQSNLLASLSRAAVGLAIGVAAGSAWRSPPACRGRATRCSTASCRSSARSRTSR